MEKNFEILMRAQGCYSALERFRRDRDRAKRYNYGDQWCDIVEGDAGLLREEDYIREQGAIPLKNNLIRRLVRNVIGVYSRQMVEPNCSVRDPNEAEYGKIMTSLLRYNSDLNRLPALYARSLEEFLIGGLIVHRKWYGHRNGRTDCWTDYVHPNNFFLDANMRDFRAWDCTCIGEIHDIPIEQLCVQFARTVDEAAVLRGIYGTLSQPGGLGRVWQDFGYSATPLSSFLSPRSPMLCRVIEVWQKEWRAQGEEVWRYYFLTPAGDVLASGDSPYYMGQHPYVLKAYPLIDGEIHSFVTDVIDQQKYTNRLITIYDWIVRSSAKGVLLVPEDTIPNGCTPHDFAYAWNRYNGVLVYKPSPRGEVPRQVSSNSTGIGITELLNLQLSFFEDISGVHGALEGKMDHANVSAALYGQQTDNATASLLDLLNTFNEFVRDAAYKDMCNMQRFYTSEQVRMITGQNPEGFDRQRFSDILYDLRITPLIETSRAQERRDAIYKNLLDKNLISTDEYLQAVGLKES